MSMSMTKSIRLAANEAEELGRVARQMSVSESALMKKWVLEGIRAYKTCYSSITNVSPNSACSLSMAAPAASSGVIRPSSASSRYSSRILA